MSHLLCVDGIPGELRQVDKFKVKGPELSQNAAPGWGPAPAPTGATATETTSTQVSIIHIHSVTWKSESQKVAGAILVRRIHVTEPSVYIRAVKITTSAEIYEISLQVRLLVADDSTTFNWH